MYDFKVKRELEEHPLNAKELLKISTREEYLARLEHAADEVVKFIVENIQKSLCLRRRADIIRSIIQRFQNEDYKAVINMIPVQVEGLLADYLEYSLIYETNQHLRIYEEIYKSVLVNKTDLVNNNKLNLGFDTIGYFKYYFNSVYRNTVAHGNFWLLFSTNTNFDDLSEEDSVKLIAYEMIFDLNMIVDMVAKSNEIDTAKGYLDWTAAGLKAHGTDDIRYSRLMLDLIGESRFSNTNYRAGTFVVYEPVRILFWIFNPYFRDELGEETVDPVKEAVLSDEFWKYVYATYEKWMIGKNSDGLRIAIKNLMPMLKDGGNTDAFEYAKKINTKLFGRQ